MTEKEIQKTLEKQLQLLSERSDEGDEHGLRMCRYRRMFCDEIESGMPALALPKNRKLQPGELWPFRKLYSDEVFWAIPVDEDES